MNNGPNLAGLLVIGITAGVSAFGLYMGYKHIEKNKKPKVTLDNLDDINNKMFDADKTLKEHKGERTKLRTETLSKLNNAKKKSSSKSSKESSKKKLSKKKTDLKIDLTKLKEEDDINNKPQVPKVEKKNVLKDESLPKVMDKKKLSTSNEDIEESLLELPNIENTGVHANNLLENETIRTEDKVNLKKKKRKKKSKKENNLAV